MDWGTLVGTLIGTGFGGALTIAGQTWEARRRRTEVRDSRSSEVARQALEDLCWFERVLFMELSAGRDGSDAYYSEQWIERLDQLDMHCSLILQPNVRDRVQKLHTMLAILQDLTDHLQTEETPGSIGMDLVIEGRQVLAATLRGDADEPASPGFRRCQEAVDELLRGSRSVA